MSTAVLKNKGSRMDPVTGLEDPFADLEGGLAVAELDPFELAQLPGSSPVEPDQNASIQSYATEQFQASTPDLDPAANQFRAPGTSAEVAIQVDLSRANTAFVSPEGTTAAAEAVFAQVLSAGDPVQQLTLAMARVVGAMGISDAAGAPVDAKALTEAVVDQVLAGNGVERSISSSRTVELGGLGGGPAIADAPTSWRELGIQDPFLTTDRLPPSRGEIGLGDPDLDLGLLSVGRRSR